MCTHIDTEIRISIITLFPLPSPPPLSFSLQYLDLSHSVIISQSIIIIIHKLLCVTQCFSFNPHDKLYNLISHSPSLQKSDTLTQYQYHTTTPTII
jgi:hypothetical protein